MNQHGLMDRRADQTRITHAAHYTDGKSEYLAHYILENLKFEAECELKESTNNSYWVVDKVYRFYDQNWIVLFELDYKPKKTDSSCFDLVEIRTFLTTLKKTNAICSNNENKEVLEFILEPAIRTDQLIDDTWISRIETGFNTNDYKCFNKDYENKFKYKDDIYVGGLADINEINELIDKVRELNSYEDNVNNKKTYQKTNVNSMVFNY